MELNWIDLFFGMLIVCGGVLGWRRGFLLEFIGLSSWLASLWLALRFYQPVAQWLAEMTGWSLAWTKALAFALLCLASLMLVHRLCTGLALRLPGQVHRHIANRLLGLAPGIARGCILAVMMAALLMALPLPGYWHAQARDSGVNNRFVGYADALDALLRPVLDDAIGEALALRSVQPASTETVKLPFTLTDTRPLPAAEAQMLGLVNRERLQAGLPPVVPSADLTRVARMHSVDMLARGYFSHHSPEGKTAFDRLRAERVPFFIAGENLAIAPSVVLAHAGLMDSPGHRANILRPQFGKLGIGIVDAGRHGIMVTQKFSN